MATKRQGEDQATLFCYPFFGTQRLAIRFVKEYIRFSLSVISNSALGVARRRPCVQPGDAKLPSNVRYVASQSNDLPGRTDVAVCQGG